MGGHCWGARTAREMAISKRRTSWARLQNHISMLLLLKNRTSFFRSDNHLFISWINEGYLCRVFRTLTKKSRLWEALLSPYLINNATYWLHHNRRLGSGVLRTGFLSSLCSAFQLCPLFRSHRLTTSMAEKCSQYNYHSSGNAGALFGPLCGCCFLLRQLRRSFMHVSASNTVVTPHSFAA